MSAQKLVRMVNQIATFFSGQQGDAEAGVADHLRSFWSPSMRRAIYAHLDEGGEGLEPLALRALKRLRESDVVAGLETPPERASRI